MIIDIILAVFLLIFFIYTLYFDIVRCKCIKKSEEKLEELLKEKEDTPVSE